MTLSKRDQVQTKTSRDQASADQDQDVLPQSERKFQQADSSKKGVLAGLPGLSLAALGIVFGDIGTSPLYTLKTVLSLSGGKPDSAVLLGVLSLLIWTLIIVATIKYVVVAMSINNDGEGGILALMALIGAKKKSRPVLIAVGLIGAALIYGDGSITPAISVLSALEGLDMVTPDVEPYVLPCTVIILLLLFFIQPFGTKVIGRAFGPVMALWFFTLAVLGLTGLVQHPGVFAAFNPVYGLEFLLSNGFKGFLVLGAVFLCVTGAEALYADMGHFGAAPIRISWVGIVFPSLILNYAGQVAIVLDGTPIDGNIFYRLCPGPLLIPLVILATLATIIASQAVITGSFSMTRQAIRLGWMPRMPVKQTSDEGYGQIYVGIVNWILMIVTISLALWFKKSDNIASAYGIAVSLTMLMTTLLLFVAMREIWKWNLVLASVVAGFFFIVDFSFFGANLVKIAEGGYVPLALAGGVYAVMWIWHSGSVASSRELEKGIVPLADFLNEVTSRKIARVPGSAVFLTRSENEVPSGMHWHLQHNRSLHEELMILCVETAPVPKVSSHDRLLLTGLSPKFWRAKATFGYMETPDIPALLKTAKEQGCDMNLEDVTFYIGHATIRRREDKQGIPGWEELLFAFMERNSTHVGDVLLLPPKQTVEIGRQIAI